MTSAASRKFIAALVIWSTMSCVLRPQRSAADPAIGESRSRGKTWTSVTNPSCAADPVRSYISQPRVTWSIQNVIAAPNCPNHSRRNSRNPSDSKVRRRDSPPISPRDLAEDISVWSRLERWDVRPSGSFRNHLDGQYAYPRVGGTSGIRASACRSGRLRRAAEPVAAGAVG